MDLLLYAVRGISAINRALRKEGLASCEASHEVIDALFTTITNANFDDASLDDFIRRAFDVKKRILDKAKEHKVALPDFLTSNFSLSLKRQRSMSISPVFLQNQMMI